MKKSSLIGAIAAAALWSSTGFATAAPAPVQVFVDGASVGTVAWVVDPFTPGGFITQVTTFGIRGIDPWELRVGNSSFNPDPVLTWGIGFTDLDNTAHTVKLIYDAPFSPPIGTPLSGFSSLVGTAIDSGTNGVTITAPASGTVQTVTLLPGSGNNVGLSNGGSDSIPASSSTGSILFYQPADATSFIPTPANPWTAFHVVAEFGFSAGDTIGLDGLVQVKAIPEPSTYAMLFAGLLAVGWIARKRSML